MCFRLVLSALLYFLPCFCHRIKKNASNDELVTRAVEAATAYENIINAIKAAEAAANKASNAADSALSVRVPVSEASHDHFI